MLRLFKNKVFLLILVTVIIFVVMGVTSGENGKASWFGNIISVPFSPVQKLLTSVGQKADDLFSFFRDIKAIKQENEDLKVKVSQLEKENRELEQYRDKIGELREALNLKDRFDDFDIIGANVIAKDAGNWFNIFRIDIGSKDGIVVNYPVVTASRGLVGRIMTSDLTSSKVISIIDEDSSVAGWISRSGGHVIIRGDLTLKDKGLCRMDDIPVDVDVAVGDVVETSGLGGLYPKGIVIGKVVEVRKTTSDFTRYAIVEPDADFKRIEEVFVLKTRNSTNEIGSAGK